MAIDLPDFFTLDTASVEQAHLYIAQKIGEYAPSIETKRGVLHDILFHLEAILQTGQDVYADNLRKSGSLLAISENPALATDRNLDELASNFRAARFPGTKASGTAVVVISQAATTSVSTAFTFNASGKSFTPKGDFVGRVADNQVVTAFDRIVKPVGDGTYYFTIELEADEVGADGNIKRNTKLAPSATFPYFVTAYAESSFTSGSDYDSNASFLKRLQEGVAGKNPSNRVTLSAMLKDQELFKSFLDVSTIGFGDAEQVRYHSLFPVAAGNRLDVYVRPQGIPDSNRLVKEAVLVGRQDNGGLWQVSITRDDAPGFYDVEKVIKASVADPESQTGHLVVQDNRGYDLSADGTNFLPDITSYEEAAYSKYQTAVVRFVDLSTSPDLPEGTTEDYALYVRAMPLIKSAQNFLGGRDVRPTAGDVLVKAAIPCDLKLSFVIYKKVSEADISVAAIQQAVATRVNSLGFSTSLSASFLHSVIHGYLKEGQTVSAIELFGAIRRPEGTKKYIRAFDSLEIPSEPSKMVSSRTTAFILAPENVAISVQNVDYTVI
jgi:hypothetical protein